MVSAAIQVSRKRPRRLTLGVTRDNLLMRSRYLAFIALLAVVATGASSLVPRSSLVHHDEIMGCETGCVVAAGGWPLPYLVDYPGLSPVGSVSLVNALLGIDHFEIMPLLVNLGFWLVVTGAVAVLLKRRARLGA